MARIDRHQGRLTADWETVRMYSGMRGWQQSFGDWVDYYRLDTRATTFDNIYDEVTGPGRVYQPVVRLGCLHVAMIPGANEWDQKGFYMNDSLRALIPYDIYKDSGMPLTDLDTGIYEMDRIIYKQKVYRIIDINIQGQIKNRPTIVTIDGTQLKADELIEDQAFASYANYPTP